MERLDEDSVYDILRLSDRETYDTLSSVSKRYSDVGRKSRSILSSESSKTTFYEDYHLSEYQSKIVNHILKGKRKYTCIPDYENLTIIALIIALKFQELGKVAIVNDYNMHIYLNDIIRSKLGINESVFDHRAGDNYDVVLYIGKPQRNIKQSDNSIHLYIGHPSMYSDKIHPSYITEQKYPVWVYPTTFDYSEFDKIASKAIEITKADVLRNEIFFVNESEDVDQSYSKYSMLTKYGKRKTKAFLSDRYHYQLPFKFYLEGGFPFQTGKEYILDVRMNWAEIMVTLGNPSVIDATLALENTCGKNRLQHENGRYALEFHRRIKGFTINEERYNPWLFSDPTQDICDVPATEMIIYLILQKEMDKHIILQKETDRHIIKKQLGRIQPYTVPRLKQIGRIHDIDLKHLYKKNDMIKTLHTTL